MSIRDNLDISAYLVLGPENTLGRPVGDVVAQALAAGFTCIQVRSKVASAREIIALTGDAAQAIAQAGKTGQVALLIDDRLDCVLAAREQGIPPSFSVDCVGGTTVAGRIFYCHNHSVHRQTNLRRAIEQSCTPYFIKLGQKAGAQALLGMAQALGFGQETVLAEGITARQGTLPSLEELSSPHELANFSYGQGKLTATPVQVAAMVSAVAYGGLAVSPKLALGSTTDGSTREPQQQTAPGRVFSERTAQILREDMIGVVEQGSATMAKPQQGGAGG